MLIAEALNERKSLYTRAKALAAQIPAESVVDPDEPVAEAPVLLEAELHDVLLEAEGLTIAINRANNRETITWDGQTLSLMEAIALRDRLTLLLGYRQTILDTIDSALGKGRRRIFYDRRSKDDVKEVSLIDRATYRKETDTIAAQRRALDIAIQRVNWSAEL